MKTIKYWACTLCLFIVACVSMLAVILAKLAATICYSVFVDSAATACNAFAGRVMLASFKIFDVMERENFGRTIKEEKDVDKTIAKLDALIATKRKGKEYFKIVFSTVSGAHIWTYVGYAHCDVCARNDARDVIEDLKIDMGTNPIMIATYKVTMKDEVQNASV